MSNFGVKQLEELEAYIQSGGGGEIAVGQYEIHPWCPREDVTEWLQKRNAIVEAYSPLVQATRMKEPVLQTLSKKHGKTPAQILIRWSLQKVCEATSSCRGSKTNVWETRDMFPFQSLSLTRVFWKTRQSLISLCRRRTWRV